MSDAGGDDQSMTRRTRAAVLALVLLAVAVLLPYRAVHPLDVLVQLLMPWLWLLVWTLACAGAGRLGVGALAPGGPFQLPVLLATGAAILAFCATIAGVVGVLRPWLLGLVLVLAAAAGLVFLIRDRQRLDLASLPSGFAASALIAVAVFVGLSLPAPPVMYDSLVYHVAMPDQWLMSGSLTEFDRDLFSYYPAAMGMLYAFPLALVGEWGTRALHLWMGGVAVLAAAALGHRLGGRRAASWAAILFGLTPSVLEIAGYAITDLGVSAWTGAALLVLVTGDEEDGWRRWLLAGLLLGTAAAAKYLALLVAVLPAAGAVAVLTMGGDRRRISRMLLALVVLGLGVVVTVGPWLGRNLVLTGNPFYPYLARLVGGDPSPLSISGLLTQSGQAATGTGRWFLQALTAPVARIFHPMQVGGRLGPHWLLLLPCAVILGGLGRRGLALWVATIGGLLGWGSLLHIGRFALPALVPGAALAGTAAAALTGPLCPRVVRASIVGLLGFVLLWNTTQVTQRLTLDQISFALGHLSRSQYLNQWVSYAPLVEAVHSEVPQDGTVLVIGDPRSLYLRRKVVVEDGYRTMLLVELANTSRDTRELVSRLQELGITHLLYSGAELERWLATHGEDDPWHDADANGRLLVDDLIRNHLRVLVSNQGGWLALLAPATP